MRAASRWLVALLLSTPPCVGSARVVMSRRGVLLGTALAPLPSGLVMPSRASAEDLIVLTDEEMAARVARKEALLRAKASGGGAPAGRSGLEGSIRSDFNPDAGVNLRSRSVLDNAKSALAKQDELKKRDKKQKREDLCEMLGRGC